MIKTLTTTTFLVVLAGCAGTPQPICDREVQVYSDLVVEPEDP